MTEEEEDRLREAVKEAVLDTLAEHRLYEKSPAKWTARYEFADDVWSRVQVHIETAEN